MSLQKVVNAVHLTVKAQQTNVTEQQHGTAAADNWQTPDTGKCANIYLAALKLIMQRTVRIISAYTKFT